MLKTCAECGHKNLDDANFCEMCGSEIGDNLVKTEELVKAEEDTPAETKMVEETQDAPKKGWWSRRGPRGKALIVIVVLAIVMVIGFLGMPVISKNLQNQNDSNLELEKNNKIQAIQNSEEFKQAINKSVEGNYSGSNPNIKYLAVKDLKSENEILVIMDVEYTSDSGAIKTHHYEGTWKKVDGFWQAQSDFNFTTS